MTGTSLPRVPEGLRDLMKVFTKDVLREKPENLYQFSANYFDGIVSEKTPQAMRKYEPVQSYEAIMKNRIRQQVPLSLVFNIIPETLTELIKQFIKAVLKECPENIYVFAREYFHRLSIAKTTQNNRNTDYTTYEKYLEGKENARLAPKVTCECGRVLSAARTLEAIPLNEQNAQSSPLIIDKDNQQHERSYSVNYLRAVCIIQKHFRQYLKRKNATKKYNSHEYVTAIYIIQRQVRRYLTRRRIANSKSLDQQQSKKNIRQHYDSATYMRAVYVIQRHYRLYRKRQNKKQLKNDTVSLTAAAFIIQRTFRRLIKARRAKKHTAAALDQGDEVNDNASEAGSYTSASTALLSTESAGEHMEFGGNFEESVHQQTIKEDEEVENNYVNFDEKHFEETTKKDGQSINSKMWESSIRYTGDDEEVEKSRIHIESGMQETTADGMDLKEFDGNVLLKQNKENSIDNGIKTKTKDGLDVNLEKHNELDSTNIISMNNFNSLQPTQEEVENPQKTSASVQSSLDDATEDAALQMESLHREKRDIEDPRIVEVNKESNELGNVKPETAVMRQENDLDTAVEEEVNITKKSQNVGDLPLIHKIENKSDEKDKEVDPEEKTINKLNSSESDEQLIIQNAKHESRDKEIEIETIEKKIVNELDKSEGDDQNTKLKSEPRDTEADTTEEEIGNTLNKAEQKSSDRSDIKNIETKDNESKFECEPTSKEIDNKEKRTESIEIEKKEKKTEETMIEEIKETILDKPENEVDTAMLTPSEKVEYVDIQPENKAAETEVIEKIIVKREINPTTAPKVEIENNEQTFNMSEEISEGETTVSTNDKVKDQMEIIEREHKLGETEKKIETLEDTIQPSNAKTPVIKIERTEETMEEREDETDESTLGKMENVVEDAILAKIAFNKISNNTPIIKLDLTEEKIEDEIDEPTVAKEIEDNIQEPSNEKAPIIKIEQTEETTEDDIDESTVAKMENIVEEAILAKMTINRLSNKDEQIHEKDESIEEVQIVVHERPIDTESLKPKTESDESLIERESRTKDQFIASVDEPSIEIEGADKLLISKTKPEEENTDSIEKIEAEEQTINIKENISDESSIKTLDKKKIEPTVIEIEDKSNETIKEIVENDVILPIIEKIDNIIDNNRESKDDKPDDTVKPDDDKTTGEENGTIDESTVVEAECVSDEFIIPKTENMSQKEPTDRETANNLNDLTISITKGEEKQIDEPIEIHPKSKANELINESTVNQIKSQDDYLTGESKDVDPTIEIKANTMDKLIAETANEHKQKANDLADETIERTTYDEPEIVNLQNIDDQQISVTVEKEDDELAKQMEDEGTVEKLATNELKNIPINKLTNEQSNDYSNEPINELTNEESVELTEKSNNKQTNISAHELTNEPTNEPINEPIIKEIKHQDIESSVAKLENNVEEDINNKAESLIQKIKNKSDESTVAKIENEVKEIFGIDNESNVSIKSTDPEQIMQSGDLKISSDLTTKVPDTSDENDHSIDKRSIETSSSSTESKDPQIKVTANELATTEMPSVIKAEKDSSLLKSNKLIGTQNFTNTNEIDSNTKKLPKEKHIGSTLESGRLMPTPIAELQLKSFKSPADSAPWYQHVAEYNDSAENENKKENYKANDKNIIEEDQTQDIPTNIAIERVPRYFNGDEVPTIKNPKRKNSVAFFISFDSDDEKPTFKVPKKFLKKPKEVVRKPPTNNAIEVDNNDKLEDESYPDLDDELEIEISENDFQQFAASKLQTIPEVNECDSSNDLRYAGKTVDQISEQSEKEVKENSPLNITDVKEIDVSKVEEITELKRSESPRKGSIDIKNVHNVEEILSNENEKHNAAVIIQNCVRAFLKKKSDNKTNDIISEFSRKVAAKKIQRAYREFTKRDIQDKTSEINVTQNNKQIDGTEGEREVEKMAALIIQKAFRSYSERKKLENYEESSHGSVTSSPMTAIRNLSISSELTSLESSSVLDAGMPLSEDFKDIDSADGTIVVNESNNDSGIDSETMATARNVESTKDTQVDRTHGLLESKLVPDTCNSIIDQNQTPRPLEQTNAVSNDLDVSTDGAVFGLVEDPTLGPIDHSGSFAGGTAAIRELVNEFLINEIQYSTQEQSQPNEVQEEPCIKKTASITNLSESLESIKSRETKQNESSDVMLGENLAHGESMDLDTFATDTLDKATLKLLKPERTIEKMSQRQVSESLDKDNLPTEASFEEPIIKSMGSLQDQANMDIEDGDLIIYKRLQREDTRESSAQSDSVVFGETNEEEAERQGSANKIDAEPTRVQFTRHYTIAGDDPRRMFKTIDDDGEGDFEAAPLIDSTSSFCLDDETSEAIRKKIMAYSLSETDSDYFDPNKVITDDSYIDTAMADDAMGTSTETESTIVSAATKIQAGARGFLTRRRLRRASAGTKSSTQETKASFGNDAISESLERFIEEEAAKKIQAAYRIHTRKQNRRKNKLEGVSLESSLAARRQKLQRGDALRNDSTPDDDNSARTSINTTNGPQVEKISKKHRSEATAEEHKKSKVSMELKWPVLRQNSMPVQIDCEVLRVIPKHLRKRIRSAESQKKNRK